MSLSSAQESTVRQAFSSATEIYCTGGVRLYKTTGSEWEYTGVCGAVALLCENDIYWIRIYSFTDNKTCFEQELYQYFSFTQPLKFFHYFEGNDCVWGLSFADDSVSTKFAENLSICVADMEGTANCFTGNDSYARAAPSQPEPAYNDYQPPPAQPSPPPIPATPTPTPPPTSTPIPPPTSTPPASQPLSQSGSGVKAGAKKEKKKKKGFGGLFGRGKKAKKPAEMVIGGPTDFKHESHIGWDMENGFDIRNIPPEWRKLFQAAGVKKSDLQDADTRKLIVSTINSNLGDDALPTSSAPPAPAPPPPPAAPPAPGAPAPPGPPPPPAVNPQASSGGLQAALQAKKANLANAGERPATPDISNVSTTQAVSLADTLASVLSSRRANIDSAASDDYGDDDDEWSDDWSE